MINKMFRNSLLKIPVVFSFISEVKTYKIKFLVCNTCVLILTRVHVYEHVHDIFHYKVNV